MSAAQIKNAFDPFFTTKQIGEGTGLGLPLAKSMVEGAGGTLTVKSTPRVGTTLVIRLKAALAPRAEDAPKTAPSEPTTPTPRAPIKGRILIVDDEDAVARAISRMLGEHETEVCTSATEALELLGRIRFDVVLSDVMMPQMNGVELYQRAVAQDPALQDRWVFISGGMFGGETAAMVKKTGCILIEKPINSGQLKETILRRLAPSTSRLH
jgi:CheY-like chemotaxis protein